MIVGRVCEWCDSPIKDRGAGAKYCSKKCAQTAGDERKKRPCLGGCGRMRHPDKGRPVTCNECRVRLSCGSASGYKNGCRCQACKDAVAAVQREFTRKYLEEHGVAYHRRTDADGSRRGIDILMSDRFAIYERDEWICQLCSEPVYWNALDYKDQPSLFRIVSVSRQEDVDNSLNDLCLAHVECNAQYKSTKRKLIRVTREYVEAL